MVKKLKILVVEDEQEHLVLLKLLLSRAKQFQYEVETAQSYADGRHAIEKSVYDVYLFDYLLPDGNGMDLLRYTVASGCQSPIIMLTGMGNYSLDQEALQTGAADYLDKTLLTAEWLEKAICHAIERQTTARMLKDHNDYLSVLSDLRGCPPAIQEAELWRLLLNKIITTMGFYAIWYGRCDGNCIKPCLWAGKVGKDIGSFVLKIATVDPSDSQRTMNRTISEKTPFGYMDFQHDEGLSAWRARALELGYLSNMAFPVLVNDKIEGAVMVCASTTHAFSKHRSDYLYALLKETARILSDNRWRKQAQEELLKAKDAAEAADRAKSQFLANMSHEIRTPLNAIIGFTNLVLEADLNSDQRDYLQIVKNRGEDLTVLLGDILDYCKIEAGRLDLAPMPISLRALIRDMEKTFLPKANEKKLTLSTQVAENVPDNCMADQLRLRQIIANLFSNAIKFCDQGTVALTVTLATAPQPDSQQQALHFCVTDTGIGIPQESQQRLFQPFSQLEASYGKKYGGTGLGLAICRRLVHMMDGEIWLESPLAQTGTGSAFHFTLRIQTPGAATETALVNPPRPVTNTTPHFSVKPLQLLVVEDDLTSRYLAITLLKKCGYNVEAVSNGEQALQILKKQSFDFVFMDIQMPDMDGMTVTRRIRADEIASNRARIPIVAVTSYAMKGDKENCLAAGMDGYIAKPVTKAALVQAIESVIPHKKGTSSGQK